MKIALLQCNTVTGDVAGNAERILAAVREAAAQGADLCVTPELALCGVAPGSYLRAEDFAEGCKAGLQMLADALQDGPPLLVGAPVASVYASGLLSNAAILVQKGRWSVVSRKVYQTYGQDSEARFFDRGVSCGILALDGWRLGVVLCQESATEDGAFWKTQYASGHNPLMELVQRGVDAIVHMAAVPFSKGVQRLSEQMLSHVAARHHVHLFSVNMVGGNDSRVYNGQSLAFDPTGQILARGKAFAEDVLLVDTAGSGGIVHPRPACLPEAIWDALTLGVCQLGVAGVLMLLVSAIAEQPHLPQSPKIWGAAIFLGLFCSGLAFVIQAVAQQYTSASHVGVIFTLEPVFSGIVAYFFANEKLLPRGYIGAALMLLSLLVMETDWSGLLKKLRAGHGE